MLRIKGTSDVTTTLPSFFTSPTNNQATIAPTVKAEMGTYVVEVINTPSATSTAVPSAVALTAVTYDGLTLTVGCVLTAVAGFTIPTTNDATYNLYQTPLLIDMATYNAGNMV